LDKLVPDYMRCPSSPLPVMTDQTGSICLSTYVGIMGGTDINQNTTIYPFQAQLGIPSAGRTYANRAGCMVGTAGTAPLFGAIVTSSGMLPVAQHKGMNNCTDGTSNTMIVGEQSDWLRNTDRNDSTKYHGDPGWGGAADATTFPTSPGVGTDQMGGFLSGTFVTQNIPEIGSTPNGAPSLVAAAAGGSWANPGAIFNVTTVRYKPHVKEVIWTTGTTGITGPVPGVGEIRGLNNPLQAAHPGGLLVAFVDGSVQFISGTTDLRVLLQIAICDDGQTVKLN
jgi:hypothetical protein